MRKDALKEQLCDAIDHRLSGLEGDPWLAQRIMNCERGEQPKVKKKISVSFAAVVFALLLAMSAAVALVHSNIAVILYGDEAQAPQEVIDMIQTPQETAGTSLGRLSVDEWMFDGHSLHTSLTIANPTEEPLLYTLDGIWLNGDRISYDYSRTDGAGDSGFVLGGQVDDVEMPQSSTLYTKSASIYLYDENGKFRGMGDLPEGKMVLKASVAVWKPINQPELVDYKQYEGYDVTETKDHLTADQSGVSQLWLFVPSEHCHSVNALQLPSNVYADSYRELGWAELVDTIEVELTVDLNKELLMRAVPVETEYQYGNLLMKLDTFDLTHAGGEVSGWFYGDRDEILAFIRNGLCVVDENGEVVLSMGSYWDDQPTDVEGVHFTIRLAPVMNALPSKLKIAPIGIDSIQGETIVHTDAICIELKNTK